MKKTMTRLLIAALLLLSVIGVMTACNLASEFTVTLSDGEKTLKTLTFEKDATITVNLDDNDLQKPGYEVEALYTDAALTAKFEGTVTATQDLTLYVKYAPRAFKLYVIDYLESGYHTVDVTYGGSYTIPDPVREGSIFLGYTHMKDGTSVPFPASGTYNETNTISITAGWQKLAKITVFDELTAEQVGSPIYADAEGNFTLPAVTATKEGYTFAGYAVPGIALTEQADGTYTGKASSNGELQATLKWASLPSYRLDVQGLYGSDFIPSASYKTGETFTLPAAPTRDGYRFVGYTVNGEPLTATEGTYTFSWSENTVVVANWVERVYITLIDEITRDELAKIEVVDGTYDLTAYLGDDYADGDKNYTFLGFTNGLNGTAFPTSSTSYVGSSVTVYRDWDGADKIFVTIHAVGANKSFAAIEIIDNAYAPLTDTLAALDGYYFLGYFADAACTVAFANSGEATEDVTVYAKYHPIITITVYNADGSSAGITATVQRDGSFVIPAPEAREGFVFDRYTIGGITLTKQADGSHTGIYTGTAPLSATAVFTEIPSFNWSVDANGGSFAPGAITSGTAYESTAVVLPTPSRDGYTFAGYTFGDNQSLVKDGSSYILPAYADVLVKNLRLTAKWEVNQNATGEQKDPATGNSLRYFREEVGGELVYVFLTGQTYYFGTDPLTFGGGHATAITPVTHPTNGANGFRAVAPGSFTMTRNGVTVNCRVEYYVLSAGAGASTTGRLSANFKGGIDTVLDAGHKGFLPDIVGGAVSLDRIPYTVTVMEGATPVADTSYTILPNGKIDFSDDMVGKTLTVTYKPTYALAEDNVSTSVTVRVNSGVNVYTNDELYAAYADLSVGTINILRNITAALQSQHYTEIAEGTLVHNDDYRNGVYLRLPNGGDSITINGNCYTIDASGIPAINPDLVPGQDDKATWADGYTGVNESDIWLVNVQVGVFVYYEQKGNSATAPGGTLYMNDLYITGNEYKITQGVQDSNAKTYWEKTYPINEDSSKRVVASSGAIHGLILRSTNAIVENVKIDHTQTAFFNDGYDHAPVVNEYGTPGNPTALLVHLQLNNVIADQNFNTSFFGWGQVGLTMTNSFFGKSAGPAIVFSDTPITGAAMMGGYGSFANLGEGTVVENFVTGKEAWFRSYMATSAAADVKSLLGQQMYPQIAPLIGVELTPTREYGNDEVEAFNAVLVTNAARPGEDLFNEDPVGMPYTPVYIGGTEMSTDISQTGTVPLPQTIGGKIYQHIPSNGASPSMQIILEVFVKPAEESESTES